MRKYAVGVVLLFVICIPIFTRINKEVSDVKTVEKVIDSFSEVKMYVHAPSAHSENDGYYELDAKKKEHLISILNELELNNFISKDINNFFGPSILIKAQRGSICEYLRIISMDSVYVIVFTDASKKEIKLVGQDENFNFTGLNEIVREILRQNAED